MILSIKEIDKKLCNKKKELDLLFDVSFEDIFVMILSRNDFNKLKQKSHIVGFTFPKSKIIFVINQQESGRTREEWLKIIVHEMVHLYYYKRLKSSEPSWFFEGLACYLAEQKKPTKDISIKDLINNFAQSKDEEKYVIGYNIINKLIKNK